MIVFVRLKADPGIDAPTSTASGRSPIPAASWPPLFKEDASSATEAPSSRSSGDITPGRVVLFGGSACPIPYKKPLQRGVGGSRRAAGDRPPSTVATRCHYPGPVDVPRWGTGRRAVSPCHTCCRERAQEYVIAVAVVAVNVCCACGCVCMRESVCCTCGCVCLRSAWLWLWLWHVEQIQLTNRGPEVTRAINRTAVWR